ncbi:MAG: GntR family transcriptional regulator [Pseudomonadota bacterium]
MEKSTAAESREVSATEHATRELRRAILDGDMPPGAPLRQEAIARELSLSRMPVRDALRVLEAEGLVSFRKNRGFSVVGVAGTQVLETAHIRYQLESLALEHAIPRHTDETLENCSSALASMQQARLLDWSAYLAFHLALYDCCSMPRLLTLITSNLQVSRSHTLAEQHLLPLAGQRGMGECPRLLAAVRDRAVKVAQSVLYLHLIEPARELARQLDRR